ncbi:MAG: DUF4093 domain-containing protein, partial [Oscillospiraceae bacterium]|nr:DUF4093 domain-containing protein [Oscillospiraceae bacterium]
AEDCSEPTDPITKADLFLAGLSGPGSGEKRNELMTRLQLPEHLGSNGFLDALNLLMSREEFIQQYGVQDD